MAPLHISKPRLQNLSAVAPVTSENGQSFCLRPVGTLWVQVTRSALKLPLPSSQFIWLSLPPSHLSPPCAHQLACVSLTEYDHMSATPLPCQWTEIDRQPEKPAFLRRPQRWQLRPSRTTSNVTRCWHSLSTHSLSQSHHLPLFAHFTLAFLMATALTQQDVHVCESSEHACTHHVAYSFLHYGGCCVCSCISQDMFDVTTQTCQQWAI